LLVVRLDAPLYFFNASVARSQVLDLVDARPAPPIVVIIDLGATADLDITTTDMLAQLTSDLADRGTSLSLAHAKARVRDRLARTGLLDRIDRSRIHFSVAQAVAIERERATSGTAIGGPSARSALSHGSAAASEASRGTSKGGST
jgi:MFS superfamily sulfate permease-like transporter